MKNVSIIIPAFNEEKTIKKLLNKILSIDLSIYILFLASITSVACQIGDLFFSFLNFKILSFKNNILKF